MAKLSEKIGYGLGDAAAGGITWKVMSIAFPFFFTNIFGLTVADAGALMLLARLFDVVTDPAPSQTEPSPVGALIGPGSSSVPFRWAWFSPCCFIRRIWALPEEGPMPMPCTS